MSVNHHGKKEDAVVELKDLEIFQMVAETGTVSEVAKAMNYVQSNITMRIRKLEHELGAPLFHRHRRGMTLTPEGKKMLGYCKQMLRLADDMRRAVGDREDPAGKLDIGTVETVSQLPALLTEFVKKYPRVDLSLYAGVTEELEYKVLHHQLDGAFVTESEVHPGLVAHEAFREELVLIADRETASFEGIEEKAFLCFSEGCGYRLRLETWYRDHQLAPRKVLEFGTMETILQSVAMGLGVSFVPLSTARHLIDDGRINAFRLPERYGKIRTVFIRRADAYLTATMEKLINMIEANRPSSPANVAAAP
jgi:DNA-binding transcriptional LysR family regulator